MRDRKSDETGRTGRDEFHREGSRRESRQGTAAAITRPAVRTRIERRLIGPGMWTLVWLIERAVARSAGRTGRRR